jgi:hypothetical protein
MAKIKEASVYSYPGDSLGPEQAEVTAAVFRLVEEHSAWASHRIFLPDWMYPLV